GALPRPLLMLLCWLGGMLLFFSFSRSKLPNYVLPVYPAALALTGWYADRVITSRCKASARLFVWSTATLAGLLFAAGVWLVSHLLGLPTATAARWFTPFGLIAAAAALYQWRGNLLGWSYLCATAMVLFFWVVCGSAVGLVDQFQAVKAIAAAQAGQIPSNEKIASWRVWKPSFLFYSGREVVRYNPDTDPWPDQWRDGVRWILTRTGALDEVRALTGMEIVNLHEAGGLVLLKLVESEPPGNESVY
ncbi:MAG TPA: hypothetical protein VJ417_09780, partial [Candidatus Glassbacteria bacterium]|nr:hypothetical protein [Candidatus Glassbacteria bacterium]